MEEACQGQPKVRKDTVQKEESCPRNLAKRDEGGDQGGVRTGCFLHSQGEVCCLGKGL